MIKSSQSDPYSNDFKDFIVHKDATSTRQSVEWGMRMIQA